MPAGPASRDARAMTTTAAPARAVPHPCDLDYHRIAHDPQHWWRPVLVLAAAAAVYLVAAVLAVVPMAIAGALVPGLEAPVERAFDATDMADPLTALFILGSIALMLPAALLAVRTAGRRPAGTLSSVEGRLRRDRLVRDLGTAAAVVVPATAVFVTLDGGWRDLAVTGHTVPLLLLAVAAVPLQAAAEEYVFRGLLMQTVGAWLRHPAWAVVLPIPLFTIGHEYDALGLVDVSAFALAAGWLTWRTGGLEAAIGLHVANNATLVAFGAFGVLDLDATEGTAVGLACSLALTGTYTWLVARRAPLRRATA